MEVNTETELHQVLEESTESNDDGELWCTIIIIMSITTIIFVIIMKREVVYFLELPSRRDMIHQSRVMLEQCRQMVRWQVG